MKKSLLACLFIMGIFMSGCDVTVTSDPGYYGWYNIYGNNCGSLRPGCNYYYNGFKIRDYQDPYYYGSYTWDYGYDWYYGQYLWYSPSGLIYDQWGNCLNNSNSPKLNRDLLTVVSESEALLISQAAQKLETKYSLSSNVSLKVARTFNDWAKLGFLRGNQGRTAADLKDFTQRLYGVDFKSLAFNLTQAQLGNSSSLNENISVAAKNWQTTPEVMKEIIRDFHGHELQSAGIILE